MIYTVGHSQILGLGAYLPEQRVSSSSLMNEIESEQRFGVPSGWLEHSMGIAERRFADAFTLPSDMATSAAIEALEKSDVAADELGAMVFVGIDRDNDEPGTAHVVQHNIGAINAKCIDITNACHGFIDGIHYMDMMIATGAIKYGLIVTGERQSLVAKSVVKQLKRSRNPDEFASKVGALSVGDAGAAMIVGPRHNGSGFIGFNFNSNGNHHDLCTYRFEHGEAVGKMRMREICFQILKMQSELYGRTLKNLCWEPGNIDWFVTHQVGKKPFSRHARFSRIPINRMSRTFHEYGNLTSATIPVNLHKLQAEQKLAHGQRLLIAGTGSGLTVSQTGYVW